MITLLMLLLFIGFFKMAIFSFKVFGTVFGLFFGIIGYLILAIVGFALISTLSFVFPILAIVALVALFRRAFS
ncbi:hypothetical protein [Lachnospira multipara]|uniref:hypothetical protein n=1 Tax=Lachnospira multipara TaxID=28051 RepID=UPI0004818C29|nr:hypothetical protein [Lachnospira multipara]